MPSLLHEILAKSAERRGNDAALRFDSTVRTYSELATSVSSLASDLQELGAAKGSRVAILLPNCAEFVVSSFATSQAGGIFVPINPLQRPKQILHILKDSGSTVLITTKYLFQPIDGLVDECPDLSAVIFSDELPEELEPSSDVAVYRWPDAASNTACVQIKPIRINDPAAILYTSGSTGPAKGVVLSHRNLVVGAEIVANYLENHASDKILAALPLSFDYGFNQITSAFFVGAEVVVTNYSMPRSLLEDLDNHQITGLAGVPLMWAQLSNIRWPDDISLRMRYITNSGGKMPSTVLANIQQRLPNTSVFLMYGLTEAFRSTYLPPNEVSRRPTSIGKAIPGVEINVVRKDGGLCRPGEPGELVHSGELVSLGYWNNPEATARRFRPLNPNTDSETESNVSVSSGDIVKVDSDGFLYFIERSDAMIKSSGYRISPSEIEDVIYSTGLVSQVVAVGIANDVLGAKVALAIVPISSGPDIEFAVRHVCARELPSYMQPGEIWFSDELPTTPNGKPDRHAIAEQLYDDLLRDSTAR